MAFNEILSESLLLLIRAIKYTFYNPPPSGHGCGHTILQIGCC